MKKDKNAELERAYRENKKGFLAWAAKATRSVADAEDLVQDAFASAMAVYFSSPGLPCPRPRPRSWITSSPMNGRQL